MQHIIDHIKEKKEFHNLDDSIVKEKLEKILNNNTKLKTLIQRIEPNKLKKNKKYKELIKIVRKNLREIYGVFILDNYSKINNHIVTLKKLKEEDDKKYLAIRILSVHKSTQERLPFYTEIYKKIFAITGKPKTILDLGCGLNPFSYFFLGCRPNYIATDLNEKDLIPIQRFFEIEKINGYTIAINLTKDYDTLKKMDKVDVCFVFKLFDSLEKTKFNVTENVIQNLNASYVIVSFPTRSLGGKKPIKKEKRAWFERILKKNNYTYTTFEVSNEFFYVINKDNIN
ncbi:MAG: hypothetical protein QXG00_02190 [Candidatus Woesearchaeota archaeon]